MIWESEREREREEDRGWKGVSKRGNEGGSGDRREGEGCKGLRGRWFNEVNNNGYMYCSMDTYL